MNFMTPPTDSFYKFCGIVGLVLFAYIGYYFLSNSADVERSKELSEETGNLNARIYAFVQEIKYNPQIKSDSLKSIQNLDYKTLDIGTPEFARFVYTLPKSYQQKYQDIVVKRIELAAKNDSLNASNEDVELPEVVFLVLLGIGECICAWGLYNWYREWKEEKNLEAQKRLKETLPSFACQSCYKTFIFEDERGTNGDGSVSNYFCKECYSNGQYTEPELTLDEAQARLKSRLEKLTYKPRRIKKALASFKHLSRWERETSW